MCDLRELHNDEIFKKVIFLAPGFCRDCPDLEHGFDTDHNDRPILKAVCDKHIDGIPDDPKLCCPDLPQMCVECGEVNYTNCHNLAEDLLDQDAISYCEINRLSYIDQSSVLNSIIFGGARQTL